MLRQSILSDEKWLKERGLQQTCGVSCKYNQFQTFSMHTSPFVVQMKLFCSVSTVVSILLILLLLFFIKLLNVPGRVTLF